MAVFALLYSDTGGGHRTAAGSIKQALDMLYPDHTVRVFNAIRYLPRPFNQSEQTYRFSLTYARWMHRLSYALLDDEWRTKSAARLLLWLDAARLERFICSAQADVYVSCQPHFNLFFPPVLRRVAPRARYVHVVTDLSRLHASHIVPTADLITTPTEEARQELLARGVLPSRVITTGQPVAPTLQQRIACAAASRDRHDTRLRVLLLGGGEGSSMLGRIAHAIIEAQLPIVLNVVCGRNEALRAALMRSLNDSLFTQVLGFVEDVPERMGLADVLITKAGSTTLAEGFIAGLPIILFDALPGQEEGPRDYAVSHGAARWCPTASQVVAQLRHWLKCPEDMQRVARVSRALARPDAALDIARALARLVEAPRAH